MDKMTCAWCGRGPVARLDPEKRRCYVCLRLAKQNAREEQVRAMARAESRRAAEAAKDAAMPPYPDCMPRYVTWRGWVVGYRPGTLEGYCSYALLDLKPWELAAKKGLTLDLNTWLPKLSADDVKAWKRSITQAYFAGRPASKVVRLAADGVSVESSYVQQSIPDIRRWLDEERRLNNEAASKAADGPSIHRTREAVGRRKRLQARRVKAGR